MELEDKFYVSEINIYLWESDHNSLSYCKANAQIFKWDLNKRWRKLNCMLLQRLGQRTVHHMPSNTTESRRKCQIFQRDARNVQAMITQFGQIMCSTQWPLTIMGSTFFHDGTHNSSLHLQVRSDAKQWDNIVRSVFSTRSMVLPSFVTSVHSQLLLCINTTSLGDTTIWNITSNYEISYGIRPGRKL